MLEKRVELKPVLQPNQLLNLPARHGSRPISLQRESFEHQPSNIAGTTTDLFRELVGQFDRHLQSVGLPLSTIFRRPNSVVHANVALREASASHLS